MKRHLRAQCDAMLSAASAASIGVIVRTNNTAMQARALLYEYRKDLGDPTLSRIQIRFSPDNPDDDLWLLNILLETTE